VSTLVKAATVQISPVLYSRQGTIKKIVGTIRALGEPDFRFATFPETIVSCSTYRSSVQEPLHHPDGPSQRHGNVARNSEGIQP